MTEFLIFAHGVGGRLDLPLSEWQVAWAAAVALIFSFAALGYFWHKPLLKKLSMQLEKEGNTKSSFIVARLERSVDLSLIIFVPK